MDSIEPQCTSAKHDYDRCFNDWFSEKFLKGSSELPSACEDLFKKYQECIRPRINKELQQ